MATKPSWNKSMGAPQNYDQWVSYHQQSGSYIADDAKRRDAYRAYATKRGLATPWVSAPHVPAQEAPPDFNRLDATGTAAVADAGSLYKQATGKDPLTRQQTGVGTIQDARDAAIANILMDRRNTELGYQDAQRAQRGASASRGMFNSGMRRLRDQRNLANLSNAMGFLDLRNTQAWNAYRRDTEAAESAFTNANTMALAGSAQRNLENWYATKGF